MGLVHVYCGDGKGKTTTAVGLTIRFAGRGGKVLFCQFMKSGNSGELDILKKIPEIDVFNIYKISKFSFQMTDEEKSEAGHMFQKDFNNITKLLYDNSDYGMVVFDEIMSCISTGFIPLETVLDFIRNKPEQLEVVMTGRDPDQKIIELADYVSEIQCKKHPYQQNIKARIGIEY